MPLQKWLYYRIVLLTCNENPKFQYKIRVERTNPEKIIN